MYKFLGYKKSFSGSILVSDYIETPLFIYVLL